MSLLSGASVDPRPLAARFARAARLALAGVLLPPLVLAVASSAGAPLTGLVRETLACVTVAGFAACGALSGAAMERGTRGQAVMAAAYVVTGLFVSSALSSLQGLTGREPVTVVAGVVGSAFAAGFGIAAAAGAFVLAGGRRPIVAAGAAGMAAGLAGATCALLPFALAALSRRQPSEYLRIAVGVASAFGSLILPNRLVGAALDRTRQALARNEAVG